MATYFPFVALLAGVAQAAVLAVGATRVADGSLTPGVLLEAELGVDSVKQVELLSRASEHYGLPARGADFRLADYETLDRIADLIHHELSGHRLQGASA